MTSLDGIIGLAPDVPENGPSYTAMLYNTKLIDKKQITLDLTTSQLTYGSIKIEDYKLPYEFVQNTDRSKWEIDVWDAFMGETHFYGGSTQAYLDTFFRPILYPK